MNERLAKRLPSDSAQHGAIGMVDLKIADEPPTLVARACNDGIAGSEDACEVLQDVVREPWFSEEAVLRKRPPIDAIGQHAAVSSSKPGLLAIRHGRTVSADRDSLLDHLQRWSLP